jgi:hypothetical protein
MFFCIRAASRTAHAGLLLPCALPPPTLQDEALDMMARIMST